MRKTTIGICIFLFFIRPIPQAVIKAVTGKIGIKKRGCFIVNIKLNNKKGNISQLKKIHLYFDFLIRKNGSEIKNDINKGKPKEENILLKWKNMFSKEYLSLDRQNDSMDFSGTKMCVFNAGDI